MEGYMALLLFVMPGYLARLVYGHVEDRILEKDKFHIIMESLLYNIVIIPAVYIALLCIGVSTENVQAFFLIPTNIAIYGVCSFVMAILAGLAWKYLKPRYVKGINLVRKLSNQNSIELGKSVFDLTFNDGEVHWVEIYRDAELLARGILYRMFAARGELYVTDEKDISAYMDESNKIKRYKGTYIDYKNNLVVKEIDTE